MKRAWIIFLLFGLLAACTYHGKVRRGIYSSLAMDNRINAFVLVIADRHIPAQILITDMDASDSQAFVLETDDGVAVAAADALATLFTYVDAGTYQIQNKYDYAADVTVEAGLTRNSCEGELAKWSVRKPGLCTIVTVSLRHPNSNTVLASAKAARWREFNTPGLASTLGWLKEHTFILSPIFTPFYLQAQGRKLRKQFEENLTESLQEIMLELNTKRDAFVSGGK